MKLTLNEPKFLKDSITVISDLVNEVRLKFDKNGISLIAMDPANVAMVDFKLLASAFSEYEINKDFVVSISLDSLRQILRRAKPSDAITLSFDQEKSKFQVILQGESKRTFSLSLIDIDEKEQKVPNLEFPITVDTGSSILDESIEDMSVAAESVSFITEPNKLVIKSDGTMHSAQVEMNSGEGTEINSSSDKEIVSKYSLDYLKKISKASKLAPNVTIKYNSDYPMKLEYNLMDKLSLSVILAPRVSND